MAGFLLNETAVKVKSEELHIPFSNLLPSAIVEYMLSVLSESEYAKQLWLKNCSRFGLESYRRKPLFTLSFYYDGGKEKMLSQEMLQAMLQVLKEAFTEKDLSGETTVTVIEDNKHYKVDIVVTMGMICVPVTLNFDLLENDSIKPYEGEIRLFMQNNRMIKFLQYPTEQVLAECFVTILEKMELINDLSVYQEIYAIAKRESVDGRKVQQQIIDTGRKRELVFRKKRFETILSYADYTYMKKKWKAYLKREKKTTPSWEEVMDMLGRFFTPLWQAITEDTIFLGDWMPELLRYLD